jgi:glutathione synthase/RimK-type ligase-like ATP-grasp enzyme
MPDVRLVTCAVLPAPDPDTHRLADALQRAGVTVEIADWRDSTVDWATARVTMLRSPWDYVQHLAEFLGWADHVATVSALWNPAGLVRWNTHKAYLLELGALGAPVVPMVMLTQGGAAAVDGIADAQGWNAVVVKPAVGVGAIGAGRFDVGDPAAQAHLDALLAGGDVIVSQYAEAIETDGEISIMLFDGDPTHAVRKRPAAGDYRIHERYGGDLEATDASPALVELAQRVWGGLPVPALYARVDVVPVADRWHVIEVEVTEPRLFLEYGPDAATTRLVDAVMARLG